MKIVNLTPHAINLVSGEGETIATFAPSGQVARVSTQKTVVETIEIAGQTVNINRTNFGEGVNIPAEKEGTLFIVSAIVANAFPARTDLLIVDETVRNAEGQIAGCKAFGRV